MFVLAACGSEGRAPAERTLEARRDALAAYLVATEPEGGQGASRPIVSFEDVLLIVRRPLIEKLVSATLPFERVIADRYRLRVETAQVTLRTGITLIELSGRASLVENSDVFADITLLGVLEVAAAPDLAAAETPRLLGHVEIYGVDTREVRWGGLAPPAERLVSGLARARLDAVNDALDQIPIPLRLEERIVLPAVEEAEVTIPSGTLDAVFELHAVRVLEQGIFVSLGVDRTDGAQPGESERDSARVDTMAVSSGAPTENRP